MSKIETILSEIKNIVDNPQKLVDEYVNITGNKVIGCFLGYCPEELVYAAKMLPLGLWGGNIELSFAKKYFPSFFCAPVQQIFELAMSGAYKNMSGVIVPALCDTLKMTGQNWKIAIPEIEFIPLVYPQNRKLEAGIKFLVAEYENVKDRLEKISGEKITEEKLAKSIKIYNSYRDIMNKFLEEAVKHPDVITPTVRHAVVEAGYYVDKKEYTAKISALTNELKNLPDSEWQGNKVILTGILLDSDRVLAALEENNITVVSDDLLQETRQLRTNVPSDGNTMLERLANRWRDMECCSLLLDPQKNRIDMLVENAKKLADGVIVCMTSFCDPEEYDYPILKKKFEDNGIPHVYIEINEQSSVEQARTKIQAFVEMLRN